MNNLAVDVPLLLDQPNYRVLVYSGVEDFICNYYGGQRWTNALNWTGQDGFNNAAKKTWMVNGSKAGVSKTYEGLSWLEVSAAGHMVPMDQPLNALNMLQHFLSGTPFWNCWFTND